MYQVFKTIKGIKVEDVPVPGISEKELLVKVYYSLISTGTETANLKNKQLSIIEKLRTNFEKIDKFKKKIDEEGFIAAIDKIKSKVHSSIHDLKLDPFGYSVAGKIVSVGNLVRNFHVGDKVACAGSGFATHSEFTRIPINLAVKIPDDVLYESACFTTIGSIALHGIRRAEVKPGEIIVIIGLGLIGQLAVQIAKAWGLRVIGVDLLKQRIELAEELGCDLTILANDTKLENKVLNYTNNCGADSIIIYAATKSSDPSNQAMKLSKQKGRIVVVGAVGMDLERDVMYKKELDFVISTSYGPGRYDDTYELESIDYPYGYVRWTENRNMQEFLRLLSNKQVSTDLLISKIYDIAEANKAIESLVNSPIDNLAVLLKYDKQKKFRESKIVLKNKVLNKNKLNVGLIGAGGFAQRTHLPNFKYLSELFDLYAIVDRKPELAKQMGNKYSVSLVSSDFREITEDKNIDLIVISTQHNTHGEITYQALKNGKSVLVEKPLAINWTQYHLIKDFLTLKENTNLFIGFNRRYSSLIIKVRELFYETKAPKFINYRINAGVINSEHWIQNPAIGGGRLVGEVCHFIDLINYLVGSELIGFNILNIPPNGKELQTNDNFSIGLSSADGSVGQISYLSIGAKSLPKEKIEIHFDSKSIVIDDFTKMCFYGINEHNVTLKETDKGHLKELEEIYKKITGKTSLIPNIELDLLATELSLQIVDVLNGKNN